MIREKKRAQHQASEYMIEDGKLWHMGGGTRAGGRQGESALRRKKQLSWQGRNMNKGGTGTGTGSKLG